MESKEITIRNENVDHSGLPRMISDIFKYMTYSQRGTLGLMMEANSRGWEMFQYFVNEYKKASRPSLLFGAFSSVERLERIFDSSLKQAQTLTGGFREQQEFLASIALKIAEESPDKFLQAVKGVLAQESGKSKLEVKAEDIENLFSVEELLKKIARQ